MTYDPDISNFDRQLLERFPDIFKFLRDNIPSLTDDMEVGLYFLVFISKIANFLFLFRLSDDIRIVSKSVFMYFLVAAATAFCHADLPQHKHRKNMCSIVINRI